MGSLSAAATLLLPVRLHGIQLGRPTDVLLETDGWRALGFVVLCGDAAERFLPYAASQLTEEEIRVASALTLLEDAGFYHARAVSFRSLLGGRVARTGREAGVLRDVLLGNGGAVTELELERGGSRVRIAPAGATITPTRASAA